MNEIEKIFKTLADFLWGDWLLFALLGLGIYYTVTTGFIQFRCVKMMWKGTFRLRGNSSKEESVPRIRHCARQLPAVWAAGILWEFPQLF